MEEGVVDVVEGLARNSEGNPNSTCRTNTGQAANAFSHVVASSLGATQLGARSQLGV